ncbi:MAG TPA: transposase [Pseudoxanthomonas sp.]|nr:transposase [Pseudoxanthomonas sp.]
MWLESHLQDHLAMAAKITYGPGHAALRRSRFSMPHQVYHVTVVTKDRKSVFLDFNAACVAARCNHDRDNLKDSVMLAWVLMPDHTHWLLQLGEQDTLEKLVTRLKCASARNVNQVLGRRGALWGRAFHEHALRDERELLATARYLVANPLRAGLVTRLGDYPFWNCVWL